LKVITSAEQARNRNSYNSYKEKTMKLTNLDLEQLQTLKRMVSDASTHASAMVRYWHDKSDEPLLVNGEVAFEGAKAELKHWWEVEQKWWRIEDDVCARIRNLKS
jgi:hypothetical protein